MEAARVHRLKRGSGLPIKAPVIDMIEIGAGGGSIAEVDQLGLLKVGPRSAGADPGPACYGLGGQEPTVTDANLLLGYLDPDFFLGGRMRLDPTAAAAAMSHLAEPLGLSALEAAWGVYTIVCEDMAAAARVHIVENGRDPRRYAMVGFGGAGPAHLARAARLREVRLGAQYTRHYTHVCTGAVIQAISGRGLCAGPAPAIRVVHQDWVPQSRSSETGHSRVDPGLRSDLKSRRAWFAEVGGWVETPVYDRYALTPGDTLEGPVIVE